MSGRRLLQTSTYKDGAVYVTVRVDCMNNEEAIKTAVAAHVAMKMGVFSDVAASSLKNLRAQQGLMDNVSVAFYTQVGSKVKLSMKNRGDVY